MSDNYVFVFDTNNCNNPEFNDYFGSSEELKELSFHAKILFPEIVIKEIHKHKKAKMDKIQSDVISSLKTLEDFEGLLDIKILDSVARDNQTKIDAAITDFDIENKIKTLLEKVEFQYEILWMKMISYQEVLDMAFKQSPPFHKDSPKGFMDACIFASTMNYIKENADKTVVVVTSDNRLKGAFERSSVKCYGGKWNFKKIYEEYLFTFPEKEIFQKKKYLFTNPEKGVDI